MIKYIKMSMLVMILSAAHADEDVDPYVGVYHGAGYNFPASLELNSDNTYSWYFYDKTALQSKGRWHLQDGQIVLNAEKNKNPILLEKLPNNGIPSIHKKIEVCVYPPGSTGSNYGGVNPKRLDISLKNRQKKSYPQYINWRRFTTHTIVLRLIYVKIVMQLLTCLQIMKKSHACKI